VRIVGANRIAISALRAAPRNENVMSAHDFAQLKSNIDSNGGSTSTITVRPHPVESGAFEIVDGHHRVRALSELGFEFAECIVIEAADAEARTLALGHNRIHGELDSREVAATLALLLDDGMSQDELTATGFNAAEVEALLASVVDTSEDAITRGANTDVADIVDVGAESNKTADEKPCALTIVFHSKSALDAVKRALNKSRKRDDGEKLSLSAALCSVLGLSKHVESENVDEEKEH